MSRKRIVRKSINGWMLAGVLLFAFVWIDCKPATVDAPALSGNPGCFEPFLKSVSSQYRSAAFPVHCTAEELSVFSCLTKNRKVVSLCIPRSGPKGYLRYVFGIVGKPELTFPAGDIRTLDKFKYESYLRGGGCENEGLDLNSISFKKGGFTYSVHYDFSACDRGGSSTGYIEVAGTAGAESKIECEKIQGTLSYFRFAPIVACEDCDVSQCSVTKEK